MKKSNAPLKAGEFLFALLFSLACGAVLLLPLVFCSCSNINAGEAQFQSKNQTQPQSQGGVTAEPYVSNPESAPRSVTICINGVGAESQSSTQSKTILPKDTIAVGDLSFVLKAVPNEGDASHHVLTGGGPHSLVLKSAIYDFFLYAFKTTDIESITPGYGQTRGEAILNASDIKGASGVTTVFWGTSMGKDLSKGGSASVSFNLSAAGLSGCGKVQLGGAYVDEHAVVHGIRIGLYDIQTNQTVLGKNSQPCFKEMRISTPQASSAAAPSYFGSATHPIAGADINNRGTSGIVPAGSSLVFDVPCGSYRAVVTLYADTACSYQIAYWADFVIVEPANLSDNRDIFIQGVNNYGWIFP